MLLWLLAVPVLVSAYVVLLRRRKKSAIRYASLSLMREALGPSQQWRRHVPPLLFLLALIAAIVAIARPSAVITLPSQVQTIVLAMDVSLSMGAKDVDPNRLTACAGRGEELHRAAPAQCANRDRRLRRHCLAGSDTDAEPGGSSGRDRPFPAAARHRHRQRALSRARDTFSGCGNRSRIAGLQGRAVERLAPDTEAGKSCRPNSRQRMPSRRRRAPIPPASSSC
jgi:hypothetical protein